MSAPSTTAPAVAAIVAAAGLALLAAACGGGSPSGHVAQLGTTSTRSASSNASAPSGNGALAFSRCMRANGVPRFPDPDGSGQIPKIQLEHLGVSDSRFQTAQRACGHLLPNGGRPPSQAQLQQQRAQALQFSRCVRAHGVPTFPDPGTTGREQIPDPASVGIDQGSPRFRAANQACKRYRPPYIPSNAAYDAWARTRGVTGNGEVTAPVTPLLPKGRYSIEREVSARQELMFECTHAMRLAPRSRLRWRRWFSSPPRAEAAGARPASRTSPDRTRARTPRRAAVRLRLRRAARAIRAHGARWQ